MVETINHDCMAATLTWNYQTKTVNELNPLIISHFLSLPLITN